jgi:hypothetical protein
MFRRVRVVGARLVLALALAATSVVAGCESNDTVVVQPTGTVLNFLIPAGTAGRIARGEFVDVIPTMIYARVGDEIVIENQDTFAHVVGPFSLRPGERVRHMWSEVGTIEGECSTHLSDRVTIVVTE